MTRKSETTGYLLELLIDYSERAFRAGEAYMLSSHELFKQTHPDREQYLSTLRKDLIERGISTRKRKVKK